MSASEVILETRGLTKLFGGVRAVIDVSMRVHAGEIVALIGPNGAGKTTFFNLVTGLLSPTSGEVLFRGRQLRPGRPHETARLGISRTFQNIRLFRRMTVLENVLVAEYSRAGSGYIPGILRLPRARRQEAELRRRAEAELAGVGLTGMESVPADGLNYGDQRRVEIARALATGPRLLLLDEPTAGMNPQEARSAMEVFAGLRARGLAVLLIEHNMKVAMGISDRVAVLNYGELLAEGKPAEIRQNRLVMEAYLGRRPSSA
jgi:branched-chain amino acid transport system ATP-binding protein